MMKSKFELWRVFFTTGPDRPYVALSLECKHMLMCMCISKSRLKDELEPMVKGEANYQFPQLLGGPYSPTTPEIRRKEKNDNVAYNQMC